MTTDYTRKEQDFLNALKADTGHDLSEWMGLISAENLAHRNDIIDWLRQQGFMFSKASWLERIHHNDGKPIYAGDADEGESALKETKKPVSQPTHTPKPAAPKTPTQDTANHNRNAEAASSSAPAKPRRRPNLRVVQSPSSNVPSPTLPKSESVDAEPVHLDAVLAQAKGFRPLAKFLIGEMTGTVPEMQLSTGHNTVVAFVGKTVFAVIQISPKDLRLGLALASSEVGPPFEPARFPSPTARIPENITHMTALDDARQVNDQLMGFVRQAAETAVKNAR